MAAAVSEPSKNGSGFALGEDVLGNVGGVHGVGPAGVKREMGDHLGDLALGQAVVHRLVDMEDDLSRQVGGDQRGHRHQAAVAWAELDFGHFSNYGADSTV